jgi:hypothetical protein
MPDALDEEISQGIYTNVEQVLEAFEPHSGFRDERVMREYIFTDG